MGGDYAPLEIIQGAISASSDPTIHICLVGKEDIIQKTVLDNQLVIGTNISILHASDVIGMSESPSIAYRNKKESSIHKGLGLVKSGKAQAFISAGNTGAVLMASTLILGRVKGVERPALAAVLPTKKDPLVMLDMGSNVDCKPSYLAQFAVMGNYFSKVEFNKKSPRVGLLNIGEEEDKGDSLSQAAFLSIKEKDLNFVGNIESKEILSGNVDVVVCDGFVGNALLKFGEGVASLFYDFFKTEARGSLLSKLGLLCLSPGLRRFKKKFDYQEVGAAPLLGINGISLVAHGKSSRLAISSAIQRARHIVDENMVAQISEAISK